MMTAEDKLTRARVRLYITNPFFGQLASRLILKEANDWLDTAATDGKHLYYNTKFIDLLSPRETEFLFGHELLHVVYDHLVRKGNRDHFIWNMACDYCVNSDLREYKIGHFPSSVPCLYDVKYKNKSAEQVYDLLKKSISADRASNIMGAKDEGKGYGKFDDHPDFSKIDISKKGFPCLTEDELEKIRENFKDALIAAANSNPGNVPLGIKRIIQKLVEPTISWKDILQNRLRSKLISDFTWTRPARKSQHLDAILPSMTNDEHISVFVSIDASGSIDQKTITEFLSEIQGMFEEFSSFDVTVSSFDTNLYNPVTFTQDNGDLTTYEVKGGGGTACSPIFEYLEENDIVPDELVILTDGYITDWGNSNYCDTTWIIKNMNRSIVAPFGLSLDYYDLSS
jgi:predicted metal-dependent peptidase